MPSFFDEFGDKEIEEDLRAEEAASEIFDDSGKSLFRDSVVKALSGLALGGAGGAAAAAAAAGAAIKGSGLGKAALDAASRAKLPRALRILGGPVGFGLGLAAGLGAAGAMAYVKSRKGGKERGDSKTTLPHDLDAEQAVRYAETLMKAQERARRKKAKEKGPTAMTLLEECLSGAMGDRVNAFADVERHLKPVQDHSVLITGLGTVLEKELRRFLVDPARFLGPVLVDRFRDARPRNTLGKWLEGRIPNPTLGVLGLVVSALSRGLRERVAPVEAFMNERFWHPGLGRLLGSAGIEGGFMKVRDMRNDATHGETFFTQDLYAGFVVRVLGEQALDALSRMPAARAAWCLDEGVLMCAALCARENRDQVLKMAPAFDEEQKHEPAG